MRKLLLSAASVGLIAAPAVAERPIARQRVQPLSEETYRVQFTATQEYVDLLETAKDLLVHAVPSRSIEEVHLRAMRALVSELKKRKTGATSQSRRKEQVSLPRHRAGRHVDDHGDALLLRAGMTQRS